MLSNLLRQLTAPTRPPLTETDARLAIGALLVRVARADGDYAPEEIDRIDRILAKQFDLSPFDATKMRRECEEIEAEAPDTVRFTRAIKESVALEKREGVIRAMWEVVLTDGDRDPEEDTLMRMVAPLLGLTDQDSNRIRLSLTRQ